MIAAALVAAALSLGSSHREAPNTSQDPTADDTDVYAFTADDAPGALTAVANWIPLEDPAGGPNFFNFDPKAHYYINVDNTGDGAYDIRYEFAFKTHIRNKNSFAAALPPVNSLSDKNLNLFQTYSVTRETYKIKKKKNVQTGEKVVARNIPAVPSNIGPKTMPDYNALAQQGIRNVSGGGKVFVGQRDDPFFVDLGQTFDSINFRPNVGTGNQGGGKDDLAGYNTNSVVLQVPEAQVTRDRKAVADAKAGNAVVGIWASAERRRIQVAGGRARGKWVQVS